MFVTVSQNASLRAYENDFANACHEFAGMKKLESNSSNLQLSNVKWPAEMHPTISWNSCFYTTHSITKPSTVRSTFSFENVLHFQLMNSQHFCCCRLGSQPIKAGFVPYVRCTSPSNINNLPAIHLSDGGRICTAAVPPETGEI